MIALAISSTWVSSAKWPVGTKRMSASGMSRLNASAPGGMKNGSLLPQTASSGGLARSEVLLPGRVQRHVAGVVEEQVELDLVGAGAGEVVVVEPVPVRADHRHVGHAVGVLPDRRLRLHHRPDRLAVGRRRVLPVGLDRGPAVTEAVFVGVAVLGDDRGDSVRVPGGDPEADRRAVVEHVDREAVEAENLGEAVDDVGEMIEGVVEFGRIRHVRLAEAGQVGRDQVKLVGQERYQVAEHVARRRVAVQQQQRGRVGRPGLPVEHAQTVHVGRAVGDVSHVSPPLVTSFSPPYPLRTVRAGSGRSPRRATPG